VFAICHKKSKKLSLADIGFPPNVCNGINADASNSSIEIETNILSNKMLAASYLIININRDILD